MGNNYETDAEYELESNQADADQGNRVCAIDGDNHSIYTDMMITRRYSLEDFTNIDQETWNIMELGPQFIIVEDDPIELALLDFVGYGHYQPGESHYCSVDPSDLNKVYEYLSKRQGRERIIDSTEYSELNMYMPDTLEFTPEASKRIWDAAQCHLELEDGSYYAVWTEQEEPGDEI